MGGESHRQTHPDVLLPNTIPISHGKRLQTVLSICLELGVSEPALRQEFGRALEIRFARVHGALGDADDGARRHKVACDSAAFGGDAARQADGDGRVVSESFLDASVEVGQRSEALHGHVVVGIKARPDLGVELLHASRVSHEQVREAREEGSCSFGACNHEERGVGIHFRAAEPFAFFLLQHQVPDIHALVFGALFEALGYARG